MAETSTEAGVRRESFQLDDLDRRVLRCLQLAPRGAFHAFADLLEVSEQTVARRYRRMREAGIVRVSAIVSAEAMGETTWLVRVVCRPSGARKLAQALARRDDVGWVFLAGVGNEVILAVRARSADARADLLLMRLPATAEVLAMSSAVVLHEFPVGTRSSGHHLGIDLGGDVEDRLLALEDSGPSRQNAADGDATLDQSDWTLIRRLEADGRASYATLASAANMTAGAATRRVHALLARGVITLGVDIAPQAVGRTTEAQIWMSAPPAILQRCGGVLAALPEVAFVAAVSGTRNLVASIVCRSHADLYRFLTDTLGAVDGLADIEVVPTVAMVKQATSLVDQEVLAP